MKKKTSMENAYEETMNEVLILTLDKEELRPKIDKIKQEQYEICTHKQFIYDDFIGRTANRGTDEYKEEFQKNYPQWRQKEHTVAVKNTLLNIVMTAMCLCITCDSFVDTFIPPKTLEKTKQKEEVKTSDNQNDGFYFKGEHLFSGIMCGLGLYFWGQKTRRSVVKLNKLKQPRIKIDGKEYQ